MAKKQKREAYFIATKLKNKPASVTFYTKDGQAVPREAITKKVTTRGTSFFATV